MFDPADWLLLAVLSHALVVGAVLVYAVLCRRESWLSPILIFLAFLELFTLPLPVRALITLAIEGDVTERLPQIYPLLAPAVWMVTIGVLAFATTYYAPATVRLAAKIPALRVRPGASLYVAVLAVGGLSLVLIALLARDVGGILPFVLLGYGGAAVMFGKGYLAAGFPWLFIAAALLLVRYGVYRQRRDLLCFLVVLLVITAMNAIMGNRSLILYQLVATLLVWHLAVRRIALVRAVPVVLVAFVGLNLLGYLRGGDYESVHDVLTRTTDRVGHVQESNELHTGMIYTITTGEFVVPFESLPMLLSAPIPLRWGATYATAIAFFVPSAIWPDRPEPLGAWYMKRFYGGGFLPNEGRAFYFLAEGYLNWGPAGVLIVMAAWGLALGILGARVKAGADPLSALVLALTLAYIPRGIAGEFSTMLVGLPQQSLLPLVLIAPYLVRRVRADRETERGAGTSH
jgi:hypothetical protein